MTTVSSGQTLSVTGTDSGDVILSGGTEIVFNLFGATASSLNPILSGGFLCDGGFVSGAQVSSGGILFAGSAANSCSRDSSPPADAPIPQADPRAGYRAHQAAIDAVQKARFEPARRCGAAVPATFTIAIRFTT